MVRWLSSRKTNPDRRGSCNGSCNGSGFQGGRGQCRFTFAGRGQRGFTLIEVLVALTLFSFAVIAHLNLQTENIRSVTALEELTFAQIVAENQLAEALSDPATVRTGSRSGRVELAGRSWRWVLVTRTTAQPSILSLEVTVNAEDGEQELAVLQGFRRAK